MRIPWDVRRRYVTVFGLIAILYVVRPYLIGQWLPYDTQVTLLTQGIWLQVFTVMNQLLTLGLAVGLYYYLSKNLTGLKLTWPKDWRFLSLIPLGFVLDWLVAYFGSRVQHEPVANASMDGTYFAYSTLLGMQIMLVVMIFLGPIVEEVVFRGLLMRHVFWQHKYYLDVIVSAGVFSFLHVISGFNWMQWLMYSAGAFVYALLYRWSKQLIYPIFAHILWNTYVTWDYLILLKP